jgi:hypothetical protein
VVPGVGLDEQERRADVDGERRVERARGELLQVLVARGGVVGDEDVHMPERGRGGLHAGGRGGGIGEVRLHVRGGAELGGQAGHAGGVRGQRVAPGGRIEALDGDGRAECLEALHHGEADADPPAHARDQRSAAGERPGAHSPSSSRYSRR